MIRRRNVQSERANVTVLTIGFLVVLGLLVVVVVNASSAFLQHRELMNLADRVALHAADGVNEESVYLGGVDEKIELAETDAREFVAQIVPADVRLVLSVSGDRVEVRLTRQISLPLVPPGFANSATIRAAATGQIHLGG
ncbi:MAG TPA: pilus assembly protein TadG-related protein [Aeromicrobium sp.]|nr:pilus assembly protein TadG-related protein [Aeromicrobium sp.]